MKIKRSSISEEVFRILQEGIITGKYKTGSWLPSQDQLAKDMGVSRPTVRAAINKLSYLGLVKPRQGAGTIVLPYKGENEIIKTSKEFEISPQEIVDITIMRYALERMAVRLVAANASQNEIDQIENNIASQKKILDAKQFDRYSQEDINFHLLLAKISKNTYYIDYLESQKNFILKIITSVINTPYSLYRSYSWHCKLADAIFSRDPNQADSVVSELYLLTMKRLPKNSNNQIASIIDSIFPESGISDEA
ncbi:MAG: FCD domain-containing protein [Desulfarculaceae bacterium]|nr:FCD domain-containing protein [Desulfarculaceae bacterium]MCF8073170.1 FCD domain-containing protein [Desulfarculaceae bacterium]MCF8100766.1 FCD domain-containing protein [Desulfarculaceae bacterium]MCF8118413.1 FCD domain-containing protein [Desulfarculaceae bacterium]